MSSASPTVLPVRLRISDVWGHGCNQVHIHSLSDRKTTGGLVFTSGLIGMDIETGVIGEGIEEQTEIALTNIERILANAGSTMNDVVKVTIFLADLGDYEGMNRVYLARFDEPRPARSCVKAELARPELKVEIEAVACIP